jgi:hypothetical protein
MVPCPILRAYHEKLGKGKKNKRGEADDFRNVKRKKKKRHLIKKKRKLPLHRPCSRRLSFGKAGGKKEGRGAFDAFH